MCKILLRGPAPPPRGKNALEDLQFSQPGDLVDAVADNHALGRMEGPPLFVVVSVPDMAVQEGKTLCVHGRNASDASGEVIKFAPRHCLNVDLAKVTEVMSRERLLSLVTHNAHIENPAVFGSHQSEIG